MYTQNRSGRHSFIGTRWLGMVGVGMVLLVPAALRAQSAGPVGPYVSKTKQEADQLVAMTKPGYYKTRLVPDWRAKQVNSAQAVTAVAGLCSRSRAQPVMSPILQLSGERLDEKQVQLTWKTSSDVITYTVEIERSLSPMDGFETVISVPTIGAAAQAVTHQTVDPNPYAGYSYYRLKRVEQTGAPTYSQTVAVKGELRPLTVQAFPNPGQQRNVKFQLTGPEATESVSIALYDVQGRVLYQHEHADLDAERRFGLPNSSGLPPGRYYLKIITKDQQAGTSFIVQP